LLPKHPIHNNGYKILRLSTFVGPNYALVCVNLRHCDCAVCAWNGRPRFCLKSAQRRNMFVTQLCLGLWGMMEMTGRGRNTLMQRDI